MAVDAASDAEALEDAAPGDGGQDSGSPLECVLSSDCAADRCCSSLQATCVEAASLPEPSERLARGDHTVLRVPGDEPVLIVFGGYDGADGPGAADRYRNDVWALSLDEPSRWTQLEPEGDRPGRRGRHSAVWDDEGRRMVVFGGVGSAVHGDLWELVLPPGGRPRWSEIAPANAGPEPMWAHSAVLDPRGPRMIVFGGRGEGAGKDLGNEAWSLDLAAEPPAWTLLLPGGQPPVARYVHAAVWDPAGARMLVAGGRDSLGAVLDDLWALEMPEGGDARWVELSPELPTPGPRWEHSLVIDPDGQRAVLYGGVGCVEGGFCSDAWLLSLDAEGPGWSPIAPVGPSPWGRTRHAAAWDPVGSRMIVIGAEIVSSSTDEVWSLSLPAEGDASWSELSPGCMIGPAGDDLGGPQ